MATIYDLFEVTHIAGNTVYSNAAGNILGIVDNLTSTALDDGEFDIGDAVTIGGISYSITAIQEPSSTGFFKLSNGTDVAFAPASESNLQVVFLTVSNGGTLRHFIIPNDSYGDFRIQSITTGTLIDVAGSDAAIISTVDNLTGVDCYLSGTMIATPNGAVAIDQISVGDLVLTRDHGPQAVRMRLMRQLDFTVAAAKLKPIAFAPHTLGKGRPLTRLCVSPQHRILVTAPSGQAVLVPAIAFIGRKGVRTMKGLRRAIYYHLVFAQHELIFANGLQSESFFPGPMAMQAVPPQCRQELYEIFGHVAVPDLEISIAPAAPILRVGAAKKLAHSFL